MSSFTIDMRRHAFTSIYKVIVIDMHHEIFNTIFGGGIQMSACEDIKHKWDTLCSWWTTKNSRYCGRKSLHDLGQMKIR